MTVQQTRAEWLAERRTGIGGSDVAALLGLSKWATPYELWLDKTGQTPIDDSPETPAQYWGSRLEAVVAAEYQGRTGRKVQRINTMIRHPERDYLLANLDRAVVNPEIAGNVRWRDGKLTTDRVLECKTAHAFAAGEWGEPGSDDVPQSYLVQVMWYLGITGCAIADLAVLIGGSDYRIYTIERDGELIADLQEAAADFWTKHVQAGIAPDPQTVEDARHRWPQHLAAKQAVVGFEARDACIRLAEIGEQMKALEKEKDSLQALVMGHMGDAESAVFTAGDPALATWKTQSAKRLDQKALREAHPDLVDLYTTTSSTRVFRLGKAAKEAIQS